jgi:hypothetical protein
MAVLGDDFGAARGIPWFAKCRHSARLRST